MTSGLSTQPPPESDASGTTIAGARGANGRVQW
jgi:hypothetical protein